MKIFIGLFDFRLYDALKISFLEKPNISTLVLVKNLTILKYEYTYILCEYPNWGAIVLRLFL